MKIFTLFRKQFFPIPIEKAWDFFSSPHNLEKITPAHMRFEITSELKDQPIHEGMRIEYKVSPLFHIPITWVTIITEVNTPYKFKDIQVKGPFAFWEHTHLFEEVEGGVEMTDELRYALPFGVLGRIVHILFLKKRIEGIFEYRKRVLIKLLVLISE